MRVNAFCAIGVFFSLEANAIVDFAHSAAQFSSHAIRIDLFGFLWNFY